MIVTWFDKYFGILLILALLGCFILVVAVAKDQSAINENVKKNCKETDLYGIGNKGVLVRIKDCSGVLVYDSN